MKRRHFLTLGAGVLIPVLLRPLAHAAQPLLLGKGIFRDGDPGHRAAGSLEVWRDESNQVTLKIRELQIDDGPDLYVYRVGNLDPLFPEDIKEKFLSLGLLKKPSGDQTYSVPAGTDMSDWGCVAVWCEAYTRIFAVGTIERLA